MMKRIYKSRLTID